MAVRESDRAREVDRIVELSPIEPARRNGRMLAIIVLHPGHTVPPLEDPSHGLGEVLALGRAPGQERARAGHSLIALGEELAERGPLVGHVEDLEYGHVT